MNGCVPHTQIDIGFVSIPYAGNRKVAMRIIFIFFILKSKVKSDVVSELKRSDVRKHTGLHDNRKVGYCER